MLYEGECVKLIKTFNIKPSQLKLKREHSQGVSVHTVEMAGGWEWGERRGWKWGLGGGVW